MTRWTPARHRWRLYRFLLFIAFLVAAAATVYLTELYQVLSYQALQGYIERWGAWAYVTYVALFSLLVALGFPSSILTVTGALAFGTWVNTGLAVAAATLGAAGSFIVARFLARDWVAARLRGRAEDIDHWIAARGALAVMLLRLAPVVPFNVVNFASGLTAISFRDYVWATAVGVAPGTFAYSYVTNQAIQVDLRRPETLLRPGLIGAFVLIVFLVAIVPVLWRWLERRGQGGAS